MKDYELFKLLSDHNRLRLIVLLMNREVCMTHLYIGLDLKQSNTSRILKGLNDQGVVSVRNKGNNRYYKIADSFVEQYPDIIHFILKLKNEMQYIEDEKRMKAVENCGCRGQCECRL